MFDKMKKNLKDFFIIILVIIIIVLVLVFKGNSNDKDINNVNENQKQTEESQNILDNNFYSNIVLEGKGDKNSGRYVTVLSDYSCGWSTKFYFDTILEFFKGEDLNKVWLQYDFLVLNEQSPSLLPTEAAYCANEQGKFWEFHDGVFNLKEQYEDLEDAFTKENMFNLAKELGIDNTQFEECVNTNKYKQLINMRAKYYLDAIDRLGVPSTFLNGEPITMFINGEDRMVGAIDIATFDKKIQDWLNK